MRVAQVGSNADNGSGGGYAYRASKAALNIGMCQCQLPAQLISMRLLGVPSADCPCNVLHAAACQSQAAKPTFLFEACTAAASTFLNAE